MRVAIADDDALVAQSLATILGAETDIEVVGVAGSGPQAVALYQSQSPDVLLLDIRMPGGDGLSAAEQILAGCESARIVFLTTFSDDEYIVRALRMGARGYLIKQDIAQIAPALRSVMAGMSVLEGRVLERTAILGAGGGASSTWGGEDGQDGGRAGQGPAGRAGPAGEKGRPEEFAALTEREFEVVEAVSAGWDNTQIAAHLFLSEGTVRNHISTILAKLGLRNRTQIAVQYYRAR
ncbi:response regulator transcription factor [Buchananella felis]|uniref:response regulator n=1 Tax=Buchananella felis TaxID=3231492 RepID=UPI0035289EDD